MKTRLPSNWRKRLDQIKVIRDKDTIEYILRFQPGKTPKGFPTVIGYIEVDVKEPHFVLSSRVHDRMQRRGLGTMLYEYALMDLGTVSTDYHCNSSDAAQKLWRRLIKKHKWTMDFFEPRLSIHK